MLIQFPALVELPTHGLANGDRLYGERHQGQPDKFLIHSEPLLVVSTERKLLGGWEVTGVDLAGNRVTRLIDATHVLVDAS